MHNSMVSFGGQAPAIGDPQGGQVGTPVDLPSPQHSGDVPGPRITAHSVGQQLQQLHIAAGASVCTLCGDRVCTVCPICHR